MAWFLALQGVAQMSHQSSVYELQDSVDVDQIAQEMVSSATLDRVVPVPIVVPQSTRRQQKVTLYVRPAAWGLWSSISCPKKTGVNWRRKTRCSTRSTKPRSSKRRRRRRRRRDG
jgi:hypothetical protein